VDLRHFEVPHSTAPTHLAHESPEGGLGELRDVERRQPQTQDGQRAWRADVLPDTQQFRKRLKGAKTGSRGGLGVLVNDAAEAIATFDAELAIGSERARARSIRRGELQGPVRPMAVVVPHELGEDAL
jgi:hypothetical protein